MSTENTPPDGDSTDGDTTDGDLPPDAADAKKPGLRGTVDGARQGAQLGAKVGGGAGAVVGGVAGAVWADPRRRKFVIALALVQPVSIGLVVVMVASLLIGAFGGGFSSVNAGSVALAAQAAQVDGLTDPQVDIAVSAAESSGVPWEILAAIPYVSGADPTAPPEVLSPAEQAEALDAGDPIGPYSIDPVAAAKFAPKHRLPTPSFPQMATGAALVDWLARAVQTSFRDHAGDLDDIDLDAGTVEGEDPDQPEQIVLEMDEEDDGKAAAEAMREAVIETLRDLPIAQIDTRAEEIYTVAMAWHLGKAATCLTGASGAVAGMWADPTIGSISSPFGMRLHPVLGVYKLHDGTDISGPIGQTVYAAGSGVVTVEASTWAGPHMVTVDHGNGILSVYGHMSAALVTDGQVVAAGTPIGQIGSEGYATGPHLHFTVWENGAQTDPVPFMLARGVALGVDDPTKPVGTAATTSNGTAPVSQVGPNEVRLNQANLYTGMSLPQFRSALRLVVSTGPDFVTLNEAHRRTNKQITPAGYASWRAAGDMWTTETPVLWRTDRWSLVDRGSKVMHNRNVKWGKRVANWVTLRSTDGHVVSVVSVHASPGGPGRHGLLGEYVRALDDLVGTLSSRGSVLVGGDLNVHYKSGAYPRRGLAQAELVSTFDLLGEPPNGYVTGEYKGIIDYALVQRHNGLTALRHNTIDVPGSDHNMVTADFAFGEDTGGEPTPGDVGIPGLDGQLPETFTGTSSAGETLTLDRHQVEYAAGIAAKGAEMGVSDNGLITALMVVAVETKFKMYASTVYPETEALPHDAVGSDHDSVGLFQQRPASGWGSATQLMDVGYSASAFFGGPIGPNYPSPAGLLDQPDWQTQPPGILAANIQRPRADLRGKYAEWEQFATDLLAQVKGLGPADACGGGAAAQPVSSEPSTAAAKVAIDFAMAQVGEPYAWGSTGPDSWDCSGLMLKAWAAAKVSLPRVSSSQAEFGIEVSRDQVQPGDLVFYFSPVTHVAMYIGDGKIIHAPRTGDVVKIAPWDSMPITAIRRVSHLSPVKDEPVGDDAPAVS